MSSATGFKLVPNAGTGRSIAIGVVGEGHALVGDMVVQQVKGFCNDALGICAHQTDGARGHSFGPFGGVAHHQHGFAQ